MAVTVSQMDYVGTFLLSIIGIVVVTLVATYMSIKIARQLGRNIAAPIDACAERIRLLAEGDLHTEVVVDDSLKEATILTTAAKDLAVSLTALIEDMDYLLTEFAQGRFTAELILSNPQDFKYTLVWDKVLPSGFLNANKQPLRTHEDIVVFYQSQCTYNPQKNKR